MAWEGNGNSREESLSAKAPLRPVDPPPDITSPSGRRPIGVPRIPIPKDSDSGIDRLIVEEWGEGTRREGSQTVREEVRFPLLMSPAQSQDGGRSLTSRRQTAKSQTSRSHTSKKGSKTPRKDGATELMEKALAKYRDVRIPYWQRVNSVHSRTDADIASSMSLEEVYRSGFGGASSSRAPDVTFMLNAQHHGFVLHELRVLQLEKVKVWNKMEAFRWKVNPETHRLDRYEIMTEEGSEVKTGTWSLVGSTLESVSSIRGVPIFGTAPGTAFVVTTRQAAGERKIFLCADTPEDVKSFHKALTIASDRLAFLKLKLGHNDGDSEDDQFGKSASRKHKYQIGITDKKEMSDLAEDPTQMRTLVTAGLLELKGQAGKSSIWHCGQGGVNDDLALAIARHFKTNDERRNVIEKLKLAGAMTSKELVRLIEARAPREATFLPACANFRGAPCLLNYRIDVNGGKLLRSSTLESLHRLCHLPLDVEVGYPGMSVGFHELETKDSKPLRTIIHNIFSQSVASREAVMRKIFLAGAKSIPLLGQMLVTPAPEGHPFPRHTLFRGRTTMLNYNIDRGGNKLLSSSTLGHLYEEYMFYQAQTRTGQSTYHRLHSKAGNEEDIVLTTPAGLTKDHPKRMIKPLTAAIPEVGRQGSRSALETPKSRNKDRFSFDTPIRRVPISGKATCIAWSDCGTMIAVGTLEGSVILICCGAGAGGGETVIGSPNSQGDTSRSPNDGTQNPSERVSSAERLKRVWSDDRFARNAGNEDSNGSWKVVGELKRHAGTVNAIHFRPVCGEPHFPYLMLASASDDGSVCVWDCDGLHPDDKVANKAIKAKTRGQRCIKTINHPGRRILCCRFAPDGSQLASGTDEGECRIFDVTCWNPMPGRVKGVRSMTPVKEISWNMDHSLQGHRLAINAIGFGYHRPMIGTGSADTSVRIWKFDEAADTWECSHVVILPFPVASFNFDPESPAVVVSCVGDDRAYSWDVDKMQDFLEPWEYQVLDCGDDRDELICASASIRGMASFVAIGLDDATVRIFAPKNSRRNGGMGRFRQVGRLCADGNATCMGPSVDARYLAMAGERYKEFFGSVPPGKAADKGRTAQGAGTGTWGGGGVDSLDCDIITVWDVGEVLAYLRGKDFSAVNSRICSPPSRASPQSRGSYGRPIRNFSHSFKMDSAGAQPPAPHREEKFLGDEGVSPGVRSDAEWGRLSTEEKALSKGGERSDTRLTLVNAKTSPADDFIRRPSADDAGPSGLAGNSFGYLRDNMQISRAASGASDGGGPQAKAGDMLSSLKSRSSANPRTPGMGSVKLAAGDLWSASSSESESSDEDMDQVQMQAVIERAQQLIDNGPVWVDVVCAGLRVWLGNDGFFQFFEPIWSKRTLHEIAACRASECILSLSKSRIDTNATFGDSAVSKNITEVIGEREDCLKAERIVIRKVLANNTDRKHQGKNGNPFLIAHAIQAMSSDEKAQERRASLITAAAKSMMKLRTGAGKLDSDRATQMMPMVVDWLLSWPKLFQIIWGAYSFNKLNKNKCHPTISITESGRVVEKHLEKELEGAFGERAPSSVLLTPAAIRGTKPTTEVEFEILRINDAGEGSEGLRVGICTGEHDIMGDEDAGSHKMGWMFGCGSGMKFHSGQVAVYTPKRCTVGDKVGVVLDFRKATLSISINGSGQGIMYSGLPVHLPLFFVVDLMTRGEMLRIPDVLVKNGWNQHPKRLIVDPLEFVHT